MKCDPNKEAYYYINASQAEALGLNHDISHSRNELKEKTDTRRRDISNVVGKNPLESITDDTSLEFISLNLGWLSTIDDVELYLTDPEFDFGVAANFEARLNGVELN